MCQLLSTPLQIKSKGLLETTHFEVHCSKRVRIESGKTVNHLEWPGRTSDDTETFENNDRLLFRGVTVAFSNTCSVLCPTQRADKGERPYFVFACVYYFLFCKSITPASDVLNRTLLRCQWTEKYIFQPLHMKSMLRPK